MSGRGLAGGGGLAAVWVITFIGWTAALLPRTFWGWPHSLGEWVGTGCAVLLILAGVVWVPRARSGPRRSRWSDPDVNR